MGLNQENDVVDDSSSSVNNSTNEIIKSESHNGKRPMLDHHNIEVEPPMKISKKSMEDDNKNSLLHALNRDLSIECLIRCPRYNYASISLLNRSFRQVIRSGEIYKQRSIKRVIEHWVYFSCHHLIWEAFDPINIKWMHLPKMTANICFELSDKESMAVGTELLVLGNDLQGDGIHKYNLLTNSWSIGEPMNTPRCLFGSASFDHFAIFAGGVDRKGKVVDTVERYDTRTGSWETLPSLLKPRKLSSGVFMDGKFYVIGGSGGEEDIRPLTCGEEYDFDDKKWTEIPNMWSSGGGRGSMAPPLLAVVDNELYAADCTSREVKIYKKKEREWVTVGMLPQRPNDMDGWGIAFRGCGKRIIIVGGHCKDADVEIYSWVPSEGPPEWRMLGRKKSQNFVYNCAIMGC